MLETTAVHPGIILLEEFMRPLGISQSRLAKDIGVSAQRVSKLVTGKSGISGDMALRLGRYFSISPQFWINLQLRYDLKRARACMGERIKGEVKVLNGIGA